MKLWWEMSNHVYDRTWKTILDRQTQKTVVLYKVDKCSENNYDKEQDENYE